MQRTSRIHVAVIVEPDDLGKCLHIDVRGRADAAVATQIERIEERHFGAGINNEPLDLEQLARVVEVAGTILDADKIAGVCLVKTCRQRWWNPDNSDGWNVIKIPV